MTQHEVQGSPEPDPATIAYAYKPSIAGAPQRFRLAPDALEWEVGFRSGRVAYGDIKRVRLSFRPMTLQNNRFLAEIWPANGPKLTIASSSWRSMVEQERLDGPYSEFVAELHRRIVAAGEGTRFDGGSPAFLYWPGLVVFAAICIALAALGVRALEVATWQAAALVLGMLALFLWQTGGFFHRNRPCSYRPDALPAHLLPRQQRTTSTEQRA